MQVPDPVPSTWLPAATSPLAPTWKRATASPSPPCWEPPPTSRCWGAQAVLLGPLEGKGATREPEPGRLSDCQTLLQQHLRVSKKSLALWKHYHACPQGPPKSTQRSLHQMSSSIEDEPKFSTSLLSSSSVPPSSSCSCSFRVLHSRIRGNWHWMNCKSSRLLDIQTARGRNPEIASGWPRAWRSSGFESSP
ncbi:hypothetical protein EYF80_035850 [Liparis tanakae]|uniref:Uncharacterized protein n=1 Tax=Liparis tanakae TaxID=230148 RepID=A0A4Z2GMS0_9TELE|nr:hypothetical protein EYF80_035850 [Liparis tanakae]